MTKEVITKISYSGCSLDHICRNAPRTRGRYILFLDTRVVNEAREYFNYDKYRIDRHPDFEEFGKNFFDISYIAHYIYGNDNARIIEDPYDGLKLFVEIS